MVAVASASVSAPDQVTDAAADVRRDRRALIAVAAQFFVNGILYASMISRAPEIRDRIGVTVDQFGLLLGAAGVVGLAGSLLAGRIVERWSTRGVLTVGGVTAALSLVVVGSATSPSVFLGALVVMFFADVLIDIAMNLQGSWLSGRRPVPVMNRLHGLWSLGSMTGGLFAVALAAAGVGLATNLSVIGCAALLALVPIVPRLLATDEPTAEPLPTTRDGRTAAAWVLGLIVLGGVFAIVMEQTASDWAAFRLSDDFGAPPALASLAFVAFSFGMMATRLGGDFAEARLGRTTLHRLTLALAAVGLAVASLADQEAIVIVAYVAVGVGVATFLPRLYDEAAKLPGRRGAGLGAMTAGTRIAGFSAPALVGLLAGTSLSVGGAVAIVTLPAAVGYAIVTEATRRLARH